MGETGLLPCFPIIVGVPRSGTTLLRFMLDAHPELAIPPETGFLLSREIGCNPKPEEVARLMTRFPFDAPAWQDFGISTENFVTAAGLLPADAGARGTLRLFYRLYGLRHGKRRTGDKTPTYVAHMPHVAAILPEARFLHVLRDGRDVALSWRDTWFAPSKSLPELVKRWASTIVNARRDAPAGKYLEVRYEALVRDPGSVLRTICDFIDLEYSDLMLSYHEYSHERQQEHRDRVRRDGTLVVSHQQRLDQQRLTMSPPTEQRIGSWLRLMSAAEAAECAAEFGSLSAEFSVWPSQAGERRVSLRSSTRR